MDGTDLTVANTLYGTSVIAALPTGYISDPDTVVGAPATGRRRGE